MAHVLCCACVVSFVFVVLWLESILEAVARCCTFSMLCIVRAKGWCV